MNERDAEGAIFAASFQLLYYGSCRS